MRFKTLAATALAGAAVLFTGAASAQQHFGKAEDAIKYRQSAFAIAGHHFSALGAMANNKAPYDAKAAAEHADVLAAVANLPWAAFGPGTDKGAPTKAKPEIWTEQAKYKEHATKLETESVKLAAAAKTGNLDNLKAAFGEAAKTCKACHDAYRNK